MREFFRVKAITVGDVKIPKCLITVGTKQWTVLGGTLYRANQELDIHIYSQDSQDIRRQTQGQWITIYSLEIMILVC